MRRELPVFGKRTETRDKFGRELRELWRAVAEQFAQFGVVLLFARPAAKGFDKRQIRRRCFVFVTAATEHERAVDRGLNRNLARKARLARARFTAEQHRVPVSFARALPQFANFTEFVRTADQAAA